MIARRILCGLVASACAFAVLSRSSGADPAERVSTTADQQSINLTIYNGASSLVHDRRRITLDRGVNELAWRDVSGQLDATSAILDDATAPGATTVREQNFNFDLLTPASLLDKYVGKRVTVVHNVVVPGQPSSEQATVLANNQGIVLKYADRIETGLVDERIVFPSIPDNLRDRPTLTLQLDAAKEGAHDLDLSYLTSGLGWRADYVGTVSADEKRMNVGGLVTLTNTTGTTYPNARLQLVAGNVNVVAPPNPVVSADKYVVGRTRAAPRFQQENFFEYHLYTLDRPTTVANAQTKQVSLLAAKSVPIRKTLELRGSGVYYESKEADLGTKLQIGVYITFTNKGGELGIPLPGGIFRLYKTDARGLSQFLGSDLIQHTPRDQDVRLHLGDSFDVTANKKQTSFTGRGNCTFDSSYEVAVANAKDEAQDVLVVEPIPGTWSITAENHPHVKSSSSTATWTLRVPPRTTTTLTYAAHIALCF